MPGPASPVSAIIPTWNRRHELAMAIRTALNQTLPLHELIIVDDGSTDGTWDDLQALPPRMGDTTIKVCRQENSGVSGARNTGIGLASGDFIAFLDSDDLWHPEKNARQLKAFENHRNLALIGCGSDTLRLGSPGDLRIISPLRLLFRNYFLTPGVMLRRSILEETGLFTREMNCCEDYDLWLRIAEKYPCALLGETLMSCGHGKPSFGHSGLSANINQLHAGEKEVLRRWRTRTSPSIPLAVMASALAWMRHARRRGITGLRRTPS